MKKVQEGDQMETYHRTKTLLATKSHWVQQEQPELVNQYMVAFLNEPGT